VAAYSRPPLKKVECVELSTPLVSNEALGFYHEKKDEHRDVGLGPSHDWSSHGADAFGLMAISWEPPGRLANFHKPINFPNLTIV
jgi:phage terminase large subunit